MQALANDCGLEVVIFIGHTQDANSRDKLAQEYFVIDRSPDSGALDMDKLGNKMVGIGDCGLAK